MCPTPLVGDASSSRGFVLASLEEHPSEAQGSLVLLPNLSMSGVSFRDGIPHSQFFSFPLGQCTGFIRVHVSLVGERTPGSQRIRSGTRTYVISIYLMLSTSLSAEIEDSHWAKPAFLPKLSSAFPLLQTCSCLLLHRKEKYGSNLGLGRIQCHGNHSIRPTEGFFSCSYQKTFKNFKSVLLGSVCFFGRGEVKILLMLSHIAEIET